MKKFAAFSRWFLVPRNVFFLGLTITLALTFMEVWRGRNFNFFIFRESTIDFWNGISPYGAAWAEKYDYFLYGPLYAFFFAPFAFLPPWLGAFVWNVFNFVLYFAAIFSLPRRIYLMREKCLTFLFTILILATTQLSFQFNVTVCAIFLLSFSYLERDRPLAAVALLLLSGFTKIYGLFGLAMLVCYPRFWRNMGYVAMVGAIYFLLPAIKTGLDGLIPWYQAWVDSLSVHKVTRTWQTFFYLKPLSEYLLPNMMYIQIASLGALATAFLWCVWRLRKFSFNIKLAFRAQSLGILMGWIILFSNSAERHTYLIALAGYMLWYWSRPAQTIDRVLLWANFVILTVVPVDLLCPVPVMKFIFDTLSLNLWLFLFTWIRMCWLTFCPKRQLEYAKWQPADIRKCYKDGRRLLVLHL